MRDALSDGAPAEREPGIAVSTDRELLVAPKGYY
jgi:hypothetical protein